MFPAVMLLATGCTSSGGSPSGTSTTASPASSAPSATASVSATLSPQQVIPLFLQCLAEHNVPIWDKAQGDVNVASVGKNQGWYENGRVVANNALYSNADALEGFYPISPDFKPEQTIATWVDNAASDGAWPKVCAPLPSKSLRVNTTARSPRVTAAVAGLAALAAITGCSSSSGSSGKLEAERLADAPAILVECVIERGSVLGAFTGSMTRAPWISADRVAITQANASAFDAWYQAHDSVKVAGKSLSAWQQWSAQNDKLPADVCGPDASDPSAMQHEVFSGDPATGNPWGN
jgi:hypothetical protein